jgi:chorismate mutase
MAASRPARLKARNGPGGHDVSAASTGQRGSNEAMRLRGIRGATTVDANTKEAILQASTELLSALIEANGVHADDVASAFFSTTPDLTAEFPALAARESLGWSHVALMCTHEMNVPGSLPMCLRILLHVNTDRTPKELRFVYLRGAKALRSDLSEDA